MTNLVAALPDLALGGAFLLTWIFPLALGERMVAYFMLLILLEFITVHSAAFMGRVVYSTTLLPMPRFGITPEVVALQHLPGEGLWIDQPQRVIAFGFLYFTATGLSELRGHGWLKVRTASARG